MKLILFTLILCFIETFQLIIDNNGYIAFCPCMGRFGNQVDQMLGSFKFAKALNRTIVLPPFIEYADGKTKLVPFKNIFKVKHLAKYHRVITMDNFMKTISKEIWPEPQRSVFCYQKRRAIIEASGDGGCNAKDGNPFKAFWDNFNVDFVASNFYSPLNYFVDDEKNILAWNTKYPPAIIKVLAFVGAPSNFPVSQKERSLQKYLKWSDELQLTAENFLKSLERPILGLHIRQQSDWDRVCLNAEGNDGHHLFASAQCLGENFEHGQKITKSMCLPEWNEIISRVMQSVENNSIKTILLATDKDVISHKFKKHLNNSIKFIKYTPSNLYLDLCLLSQTDFFIANCVSTYSAVATYERRLNGLPVDFWGFNPSYKDEL